LLALPIESNELIRRIRATEPGDRMPLAGSPLSKDEVDLLVRWIASGAQWPAEEPVTSAEQHIDPWYVRAAVWAIDVYESPDGRRFLPCGYALVAVLFLGLWQLHARSRLKTAAVRSRLWNRLLVASSSLTVSIYLNLLLVIALWAGWRYVQKLDGQRRDLQTQVLRLAPASETGIDLKHRIRPQHPPRLAGEYYRGNDERSPALFNGGFYRTCTFRVELRNAAGERLQWGDPWPESAFVHFEIIQAPFTTKVLFDPEAMQRGGLWEADPQIPELVGDERMVNLSPLPGRDDAWQADYPLPLGAGDSSRGSVYVYREFPRIGKTGSTDAHYVIGYDLHNDDDRIGTESEIWMESLYNVSKIDYPAEGKLMPVEWFSSLPIPEIVGGNTSDPVLLGIPEHERRLK
jgi:hypothetical protein